MKGYYFYNEDGNILTFFNFEECKAEAIAANVPKFRDTIGGEYFI